jgi:hypothetical protein
VFDMYSWNVLGAVEFIHLKVGIYTISGYARSTRVYCINPSMSL